MIKQFYLPVLILLAIFLGIDYLADTIKDFITAILPQQFQDAAPLASFLQIPIDAISNTVSSIVEFFKQFANIFISLFSWIFGDGKFVEILSAIVLMFSALVAFVAYVIIAVVGIVAGIIIFALALLLSIASWIL